jgi:hypothetical protein
MSNLTCVRCSSIVLEVEGQLEKLDSYYLEESGPPRESVGYWHTSCLRESPFGLAWHNARLKNHITVRGYREVASTEQWSVIRHPRTAETFALSRQGEWLSFSYPEGLVRRIESGAIYRVRQQQYNLHLEGYAPVVQAIQQALISTKTFPVISLFEMLGIADRVSHPEALEGGVIRYNRSFHRDWDNSFVAASWEYGVCVPTELASYVVGKV